MQWPPSQFWQHQQPLLPLTPTMGVTVGIDLGIYEWNKTFGPYKIDALGIKLGTETFPTHNGTKGNFEMHNIGTRPPR